MKLILHEISIEEIKNHVSEAVQVAIDVALSTKSSEASNRLISRKELAKRLGISLPTLHTHIKSGLIIGYRLNGRLIFDWESVKAALPKI